MGKSGDSGKDGITIADGQNMIFDHVSVTWGRDETFSINGDVTNVTIQDSIIGQGLDTHSCGGLMQTDGGVSLFRNLYIDNKTRNPKVKGVNDFQNNVRLTRNEHLRACYFLTSCTRLFTTGAAAAATSPATATGKAMRMSSTTISSRAPAQASRPSREATPTSTGVSLPDAVPR